MIDLTILIGTTILVKYLHNGGLLKWTILGPRDMPPPNYVPVATVAITVSVATAAAVFMVLLARLVEKLH